LVHNFTPKILPEESAKLRWAGRGGRGGTSYFIASVVQWIEKALDVGGPSSIECKYFWGSNKKQQSCDRRGGGRAAPRLAWQ
jgi:hypothetical protein